MAIRVVTFNILNGRAPSDGEVHPERFADSVLRLRPDILALQEVDRAQPRSGSTDFTNVAAQAMDAVASRFVAAIAGTPGMSWSAATGDEQPDSAAYGVALLSRYPVHGWRTVNLPRLSARVPAKPYAGWRPFLAQDEPRVAVSADVETPIGCVSVTSTHLSFVPGWNLHQLRILLRALEKQTGPQLLLGDLNVTPSRLRRFAGWRPLVQATTFPASRPALQLDHVLARGRITSREPGESVELAISDHRALVAVI